VTFDRETYFAHVRDTLFGGALSQQQVDGQSVILAVWEYQAGGTPMTDTRWLAYMLATVYHECATRMWPTTEYGSQAYLQGKPYWPYFGRGFVQLTWEDNYDKASKALSLIDDRDLVAHPEVALDSLISARVMFRGMAEGWFTGRKLGQYFNDDTDDPVNARQIINGNDDDEMIADYHNEFYKALIAASGTRTPVVPDVPLGKAQVAVRINSTVGVETRVFVNGEEVG
jgi:putative chitinase